MYTYSHEHESKTSGTNSDKRGIVEQLTRQPSESPSIKFVRIDCHGYTGDQEGNITTGQVEQVALCHIAQSFVSDNRYNDKSVPLKCLNYF